MWFDDWLTYVWIIIVIRGDFCLILKVWKLIKHPMQEDFELFIYLWKAAINTCLFKYPSLDAKFYFNHFTYCILFRYHI